MSDQLPFPAPPTNSNTVFESEPYLPMSTQPKGLNIDQEPALDAPAPLPVSDSSWSLFQKYHYHLKLVEQRTVEGLDRVVEWIEKYAPHDHEDYFHLMETAQNQRNYLTSLDPALYQPISNSSAESDPDQIDCTA